LNKNDKKWFISPVLKYFKTYSLLKPGDSVCLSVSGGIDSIVMAYILHQLSRFSWLKLNLHACRVEIDFSDYAPREFIPPNDRLKDFFADLNIPYSVLRPSIKPVVLDQLLPVKISNLSLNQSTKINQSNIINQSNDPNKINNSICSICSRIRKGILAQKLAEKNIKYLLLGHHSDDVAETMLMNICMNRSLKTMYPVVDSSDNSFITLRPMLYFDKEQILKIHKNKGLLDPLYFCPFEKDTLRIKYRKALSGLKNHLDMPQLSKHITLAFENPDLKDPWPKCMVQSDCAAFDDIIPEF
jgi:tRNA 2-thiocytidine biosynthesis protein TtcA